MLYHGSPLIRARRAEVLAAGVEAAPRLAGVRSGKPLLEDGRILPAEAVTWATGSRPDFSWIDLPVFDERGYPRHARGVVAEAPGLYFVGLAFQYSASSTMIQGVSRDAKRIAEAIAARGG